MVSISLKKVTTSPPSSRKDVVLALTVALMLTALAPIEALFGATSTFDLTTTIQDTITFTTATQNFGNLTPGTPGFATTTLAVTTNSADGWNVSLSGNDVTDTVQAMDLTTDTNTEITDLDPQWIPGAATSSAGNAVAITSGQDVLAFRVKTATGSPVFISTDWWGADDTAFTDARWAGLASSTAANTKIGQSSVPSVTVYNDVQYYLDVPVTQTVGDYTAPITFTAIVNP